MNASIRAVFIAQNAVTNTEDNKRMNLRSCEVCPEVNANEIHALYYRHQEVSRGPNPYHKASNSAIHEGIWKLQLCVICSTQGASYMHFWT